MDSLMTGARGQDSKKYKVVSAHPLALRTSSIPSMLGDASSPLPKSLQSQRYLCASNLEADRVVAPECISSASSLFSLSSPPLSPLSLFSSFSSLSSVSSSTASVSFWRFLSGSSVSFPTKFYKHTQISTQASRRDMDTYFRR